MKKFFVLLGVLLLIGIVTSSVVYAKSQTTTATKVNNEVINYVYVDVKGEVNNPGVYRVSDKCRVFQVLEIAGGLKNTAETSGINLSAKISDEQMIRVPSSLNQTTITVDELININTATATELDNLPGVGYSTATNIIDYRINNGQFKTKEEIKNVSGIGDAIYEQIKDLITIW